MGETFYQQAERHTPVQRGKTPLLPHEDLVRLLVHGMGLAFDDAVNDCGKLWATVSIDHWNPAKYQVTDLRRSLWRLRDFEEKLLPNLKALEALVDAMEDPLALTDDGVQDLVNHTVIRWMECNRRRNAGEEAPHATTTTGNRTADWTALGLERHHFRRRDVHRARSGAAESGD